MYIQVFKISWQFKTMKKGWPIFKNVVEAIGKLYGGGESPHYTIQKINYIWIINLNIRVET